MALIFNKQSNWAVNRTNVFIDDDNRDPIVNKSTQVNTWTVVIKFGGYPG